MVWSLPKILCRITAQLQSEWTQFCCDKTDSSILSMVPSVIYRKKILKLFLKAKNFFFFSLTEPKRDFNAISLYWPIKIHLRIPSGVSIAAANVFIAVFFPLSYLMNEWIVISIWLLLHSIFKEKKRQKHKYIYMTKRQAISWRSATTKQYLGSAVYWFWTGQKMHS